VRRASRDLRDLVGLIHRNHSLLLVLAAFATTVALAAISGNWFFYRGAYVLGALIPLCLIWARINIRGLEVTVARANDRLQVGQEVEARVRLQSRSAITKLWLEVEDETDMPGVPPRTVVTLPAKSSRNWKVNMTCARRGVYSTGPVRLTSGDPFGLFRFSRTFGASETLVVLPRPQELPYFWSPAAQLPGEGIVRRRTHYVTPNASSVREYYPGDSYNRIHWRSTARLRRLMVKTYEMDPTSNVWIVLDLHRDVQAGSGDDGTEEYAVSIAASLAYHFAQANRMLGLIACGRETVAMDPARGSTQYGRILEALATARAEGPTPLARLLEQEGRRFGRHTTVIVVTPSPDAEWTAALHTTVRQGARAAAVLLEPGSFGLDGTPPLPLEELAASNVLTYVVPCGSDISLMLGPAGLAAISAPERRMAGVR